MWIQRIEIDDFRGIHHLDMSFPTPGADAPEPWIMLLGENGVGKTSILKAIALALVDDVTRTRLAPDASACVNVRAKGASGRVRISFDSSEPAVELTFRRGSRQFSVDGRPPDAPLLAYGPTRLPPISEQSHRRKPQPVRVHNLFDPRVQLGDIEGWLTNVRAVTKKDFDTIAISLKDLLQLPANDRISRAGGRLTTKLFGSRIPLRDLSDGYQSMMALCADIILNLSARTVSMESVEGTVLLDELEVHLHPRWKLEIVDALRRTFPRVRFVATTHDPLCLRGLRNGEVHRLSRDPRTHVVTVEQIDVPPGLRADQLLTSRWFDLYSTLDKDTLEVLAEYNRLLLARHSPKNLTRRAELERILRDRFDGFGETAIERLAQDVAAKVMRDEQDKPLTADDRERIRQKILKRVNEIKDK